MGSKDGTQMRVLPTGVVLAAALEKLNQSATCALLEGLKEDLEHTSRSIDAKIAAALLVLREQIQVEVESAVQRLLGEKAKRTSKRAAAKKRKPQKKAAQEAPKPAMRTPAKGKRRAL